MIDFISAVKNVLEDKNLTLECLFNNNVVSKNTFYKYKQRNPSLQTLIKVANFLETSIDYLFELRDDNKFSRYYVNQSGFYSNLIKMIKNAKISSRQFCKEVHISKDNILRYKNGANPSLRTLLDTAKYFNCFVDDLLATEKH